MPTPSASWTTPPDWSTSYVVLADDLDTYLSSNLLFLYTGISARVYNSASVSIANNTEVTLTFDSERWDTNALHSTSSNTNRLTAPTTGLYLITAQIQFAANATGNRQALLYLNGSTLIAAVSLPAVSGTNTHVTLTTHYRLSATDYVEIRAYQNSGGALNSIATGNTSPEFMMTWLSA